MTDRKLLERITSTLVDRFRPRRIIFLGSHARAGATSDSDPDLFVEMEIGGSPPERTVEVSSVFGLRPGPLDLVVYTPEEVERLRRVNATWLSAIEAEGKVRYECP